MTYHIRQAQPEDAEKLLEHLRHVADEPNNGISLSSSDELKQIVERETEIIADSLNSDDKVMFVAEADVQIIGLRIIKAFCLFPPLVGAFFIDIHRIVLHDSNGQCKYLTKDEITALLKVAEKEERKVRTFCGLLVYM